jgi:hypothetical protein
LAARQGAVSGGLAGALAGGDVGGAVVEADLEHAQAVVVSPEMMLPTCSIEQKAPVTGWIEFLISLL